VDAQHALDDLMEISSQVERAVLLDDDGGVVAATPDGEAGARLAERAHALLATARDLGAGEGPPDRVEAALPDGSVFVVREGGRTIAATTGPRPTAGLVFYDLRSCLRSLEPAGEGT
jgi:hypothetical protein